MDDVCVICNERFPTDSPDVVTLREKGSEGINQASAERNDQIVKGAKGS